MTAHPTAEWTAQRSPGDSKATSIWWLNGEEVIDIYGIQTVIDNGVSKRVTLAKG